MKKEKEGPDHQTLKKMDPRATKQAVNKSGLHHPESGRGANANDDPSEDSKGGGNAGSGNQEGANQGKHPGAGLKR